MPEPKIDPPKEDTRTTGPTDEEMQERYGSKVRVIEGDAPPEGDAKPEATPVTDAEPTDDIDFETIAQDAIGEFDVSEEPAEVAAPEQPGTDFVALFHELDEKAAAREERQADRMTRTIAELKTAESEYDAADTTIAAKTAEKRIDGLQTTLNSQAKEMAAIKTELTETKKREEIREERAQLQETDRQITQAKHLARKLSAGGGKDPYGRPLVLPETIEARFDDMLRSDPQLRGMSLLKAASRSMPKIMAKLYGDTAQIRQQMGAQAPATLPDAGQPPASPQEQQPVAQGPPPTAGAPAGTQGTEYDVSTKKGREAFWDDHAARHGAAK